MASQINDFGFINKSITLRNAYDVFLLSKKTIAKNAFLKFNRLKNHLQCFLASCFEVFNKPESLKYISSNKTKKYMTTFNKYVNNKALKNQREKKTRLTAMKKRNMHLRFLKLFKCLFYKEYRNWLINCVRDKNWRKEKLIQLGIKKP